MNAQVRLILFSSATIRYCPFDLLVRVIVPAQVARRLFDQFRNRRAIVEGGFADYVIHARQDNSSSMSTGQ